MDGSLYERDFYSWTQQQAAALRRLAAERANLGAELDLPHLIEEVADLGSEQVHAVTSHLYQLLRHLIFVAMAPDDAAARHWSAELIGFQRGAADRYLPSMRQIVEPRLAREWRAACRSARAKLAPPPTGLPATCPFTLDELLDEAVSIDALLARLHPTTTDQP